MKSETCGGFKLGDKKIGESSPVYFIAEIGSNFDGNLDRAKDLILMAKEAGADAAKFQHYTASSLVSDYGFRVLGNKKSHQSNWAKSVHDTYDSAALNREWTESLRRACDEVGLAFLTSPYSIELVDFVNSFVPAFKIGSGDITWIEIIEYMARKKKPILLATGASDMADVRRAVEAILRFTSELVLMQCNTNYTVDKNNFSHLHLNVLRAYAQEFPNAILGLSDHTPGHASVLGAVALGARVIEKHFTDSNDRKGPDHAFAMNPQSWREMVDRTRELELALGGGQKKIEENEQQTIIVQRRSIRLARNLDAGSILSMGDLEVLRPCPQGSIPPFEIFNILGMRLKKAMHLGEHLKWEDLE